MGRSPDCSCICSWFNLCRFDAETGLCTWRHLTKLDYDLKPNSTQLPDYRTWELAPIVGSDHVAVVVETAGFIYGVQVLSPDLEVEWSRDNTSDPPVNPRFTSGDNYVGHHFGSITGTVFAVTLSDHLIQMSDSDGSVTDDEDDSAYFAISIEDEIYQSAYSPLCGNGDGGVWCLSSPLELRLEDQATGDIIEDHNFGGSKPTAMEFDGSNYYAVCADSTIKKMDDEFGVVWSVSFTEGYPLRCCVGADSVYFVGLQTTLHGETGNIFCLSKSDGSLIWSKPWGNRFLIENRCSCCCLAGDGSLWVSGYPVKGG
ncbi:hypothetical protein GC163_13295 [bacterium]|nr:hypothetical protein [bacterium]